MVTAGVYMMARNNLIYALAPDNINTIIALIGITTALIAATMALTEMDLKRVLAYSTISQLGYMVVAAGVGAYTAAMFHLMTHAFFKALLFMGAGSVMHATHDVIDMRRLGGLKDKMPTTFRTFVAGSAALAGLPLITAGFWSKDAILVSAFAKGGIGYFIYLLGLFTAFLTAFYIFRAVFMTFYGQPKDAEVYEHAHENKPVMTVPLMILAVLAIIGGFVGIPSLLWVNGVENYLYAVMEVGKELAHLEHHLSLGLELFLLTLSGAIAIGGIYGAYHVYIKNPHIAENTVNRFPGIYKFFYNKYYVDEFYLRYIVNPLRSFANFLSRFIDVALIDNFLVDGTGKLMVVIGGFFTKWQTGYIRNYVTSIFIGCIIIGIYFFSPLNSVVYA